MLDSTFSALNACFCPQGLVVWEGTVEEFDTSDEPIVRQFASGSLNGPIQYE